MSATGGSRYAAAGGWQVGDSWGYTGNVDRFSWIPALLNRSFNFLPRHVFTCWLTIRSNNSSYILTPEETRDDSLSGTVCSMDTDDPFGVSVYSFDVS